MRGMRVRFATASAGSTLTPAQAASATPRPAAPRRAVTSHSVNAPTRPPSPSTVRYRPQRRPQSTSNTVDSSSPSRSCPGTGSQIRLKPTVSAEGAKCPTRTTMAERAEGSVTIVTLPTTPVSPRSTPQKGAVSPGADT
eukprot:471643-Pyramimonas_sp.AAC.1